MSKQSRGDLGEQKVIAILNNINGHKQIINNLTLDGASGMTHQIDHIFINEKGIFVIESKSYYGKIYAGKNDSIWIKEVKNRKERMPNPITQNKSHIRIVKNILKTDLPIISIVVFTLNNAPYLPDENVINLDDLETFVLNTPSKRKLSQSEIDRIYNYLLSKESYSNMKMHLNNIKKIKTDRAFAHKEIAFAIENRKCPHCHNPIIEEQNNYFICRKCGFHFHL